MNWDFLLVVGNLEVIAEFSDLAVDLNSLSEEFCEVGSVEDFIFDWFWAVNTEVMANFLLLSHFCVGSFSHG